jgi:predicted dehydrogenase
MNRRQFVKTTAAGLAVSAFGVHVAGAAERKSYRAGLIGTGWYGKSDLWRLIQVAPVEVESLCDVDRRQLAGAAEMAARRQKSGKTPRTYIDYRAMLKEKDLDIVLIGTPCR